MEDKYIPSTKTYEDWRNYLIVNSFFFDVLLKDMRKKLGLPENGLKDDMSIIRWDGEKLAEVRNKNAKKSIGNKSGVRIVKELLGVEDATRREAYKPIWEAIEKFNDLNLSYSLLHPYVLGQTNLSFSGSSRVIMVSSPNDPICETGIYIKYNPDLSEKEMSGLMKQAKDSYQTLFSITHDSERTRDKNGKPYIKHPKLKIVQRKATEPAKEQLEIYKAIESHLKANYSTTPDAIKMDRVFINVAQELKINKNTLQRRYYALLRNFQLPTSVDTRKISN